MSLQTNIDPASTQQLLTKLYRAIEKTKLVLAINELDEKIRNPGTDKINPAQLATIQQEKTALTTRLNRIKEAADRS